MPDIAVTKLVKRFGGVTAVDHLSFTAEPGAVTGFLGPNGSGKSTTIRALLGLVHPTSGGATIGGVPYAQLERPLETVGAALETTGFHAGRSGRNHLRWIAAAAGLPASRSDELLERVGLTDAAKRKVGGYSLGMKQRLALAAALLGDPGVLILDEPANGLDPEGIHWLRDFLTSFAADGRTVLVSSHVLSEIEQMAQKVVIIDHGQLIREDNIGALTSESLVVKVRSPQAGDLAGRLEGAGAGVELIAGGLTVRGIPQERVGEIAAEANVVLHELSSETQSLEGAFLDLTGGSGDAPPPPPPPPTAAS